MNLLKFISSYGGGQASADAGGVGPSAAGVTGGYGLLM